MNGIVGSLGAFSRSIEAASAENRFRNASLPPGEYAGRLESRLLGLDATHAAILPSLETANLTRAEREAVIARLVTSAGDWDGLGADLDAMLVRFGLTDDERRGLLACLVGATHASPVLCDSTRLAAA